VVNTCVARPDDGPAAVDECVDRAWSGDGYMGRQVLERLLAGRMKMAHVVAGTVFVHAGVTHGALTNYGIASIEELNTRAREAILEHRRHDFVLRSQDADGPAWTRQFKDCDVRCCLQVKAVLDMLGAKRMVKGHDPHPDGEAEALCRGTLIHTDTLMSVGFTKNRTKSERHLMAFETSTEGDDAWFVYPMRAAGERCKVVK